MLGNQINFQWRVTKYNPDLRDENGYYTLIEEWTCPSEIGKTINGDVFTSDEYLQVEAAYIHSVIKFIEESRMDSLRILQLECMFQKKISYLLYMKKSLKNWFLKKIRQ